MNSPLRVTLSILLLTGLVAGQASFLSLTPGRHSRADADRRFGKAAATSDPTLLEYTDGGRKVYVQVREGTGLIDRVEALFPTPLDRATVLKMFGVATTPATTKWDARGRMQEYFGGPHFVVITHGGHDAASPLIRAGAYSSELFAVAMQQPTGSPSKAAATQSAPESRPSGGFGPMTNSNVNGTTLTFYRGTTPEKCQADCGADPKCKAFGLVKAGYYNPTDPPMCYLVAEVTFLNPSDCCISAVKDQGTDVANPAGDEVDLAGTWTMPYTVANLRYTRYLDLSGAGKNKWSGTQTSRRQDGSRLGSPIPVTVEYLGAGKVRYNSSAQRADATFANGKLTIRFGSGDVAVYTKQ
ncbi:MAG: hypothetical protein IPM25_13275 [Chloracidobacterium sp.]|nr:hypothetical protein [Chloracidobacterium sp.]